MKPLASGNSHTLRRRIPSELKQVDVVCQELRELLERQGAATAVFSLDLVARECLNNAILHGNGRDVRKRVEIEAAVGPKWIRFCVGDEGPGFPWRRVSRRAIPDDCAVCGRGMPIISQFASRVRFNRRGNQITVWLEKPCT